MQLGAQRLFTLAQQRHSLTQLLNRDQLFLIGTEKPFDTFDSVSQFSLQALFALFGRISIACRRQAAVEFLLDQRWILKQSDHLNPDDLIQQFLSHEASVVTHGAAQLSPPV